MPRLRLLLFGWLIWMAPIPGTGGQGTPSNPSRSFVSQISPDLAIVTEVSLDTPYVGQQFSIIYKLRAQRPPAAVDIDPQQYSGFWTELVPISQDTASSPRVLKGQAAVDYLLRQVIAYPLLEGKQKLPPLSLKVKRAGNISDRRDDWDLLGASTPVDIVVASLPPTSQAGAGTALVGSVTGAMNWAGGGRQALMLEIQGTANLALFKPLDWLPPPAGVQVHEQLVSADKQTQTMDIEGKRQLSLVQRQRWLLSVTGGESGQRFEGFFLPVFEPREKVWKSIRIEGLSLPGSEPSAPGSNVAGKRVAARTGALARLFQSQALVVAFGVTGLAAVLVWIFWMSRNHARGNFGGEASIAVLEKKLRTSPRAFLDGAHKVLARCAVEMQRAHNLGAEDALLDRCWTAVQKHRFTVEPLTLDACEEMFKSIKQLLLSFRTTE